LFLYFIFYYYYCYYYFITIIAVCYHVMVNKDYQNKYQMHCKLAFQMSLKHLKSVVLLMNMFLALSGHNTLNA